MQCPRARIVPVCLSIATKSRAGGEPSWKVVVSGALVQPGLFALVTLLSFPPRALEPVLRSGSQLEGRWSHCKSASEE